MIVSKANIKAFKSILDLSLSIDEKITVLIGPNEGGKTNILKALESFKPDSPFDGDLTCQYSDYYYQGRCPEVTLEFSQIPKQKRALLMQVSDTFKEVESFQIRREGPDTGDYKVLIEEEEINVTEPKRFLLLDLLPKILFFDTIPLLKNRVDRESLINGGERFQTERNLLRMGGVTNIEHVFEDSTRGRRTAEEASRNITEQIREVWSQEPSVQIKLNVNGENLHIDISDDTTVFDTPDSRSLGFLWFLSFYVNFFSQVLDENRNREYLFLIEEPGIHLHPTGQKDLVRLIEILAESNQVIYTTHSPFMINRNYPQRVKVVTRGKDGTVVDNEAYRQNWKPLRKSIGLMIGDLFFLQDSGLLLEMPAGKFMNRLRKSKAWRNNNRHENLHKGYKIYK